MGNSAMIKLQCNGVGRDGDCITALSFYFNRKVTDDEMRFLHEVLKRASVCMPSFDDNSCPGHIASIDNPKICRRCGVHIDTLRPE